MAAEPDTARVNEYLFRIRQLAQSQNSYVLHFDCAVGDLRAWLWYVLNIRKCAVSGLPVSTGLLQMQDSVLHQRVWLHIGHLGFAVPAACVLCQD